MACEDAHHGFLPQIFIAWTLLSYRLCLMRLSQPVSLIHMDTIHSVSFLPVWNNLPPCLIVCNNPTFFSNLYNKHTEFLEFRGFSIPEPSPPKPSFLFMCISFMTLFSHHLRRVCTGTMQRYNSYSRKFRIRNPENEKVTNMSIWKQWVKINHAQLHCFIHSKKSN